MVFAVVLSIACALGSVILWFLGLWGIGQWWMNENASRRKGRRPLQRDWVFAENAVSTRNVCNLRDGERQFRVDLLLKETTGLDMEDISLRIKRRDRAALARADVDEDAFCEVSCSGGPTISPPSTAFAVHRLLGEIAHY